MEDVEWWHWVILVVIIYIGLLEAWHQLHHGDSKEKRDQDWEDWLKQQDEKRKKNDSE